LVIEPDLVILVFYENDIDDLGKQLWMNLEENRKRKSRFPFSIVYPVVRNTALWNLALRVKGSLQASRIERQPAIEPQQQDLGRREEYASRLLELSELLRKQGVDFMFALFPSHHTVFTVGNTTPRTPVLSWVVSAAHTMKLETVSLLEPLQRTGRSSQELYLLPHDGHASPFGYKIAAGEIAEKILKSRGLNQRRCAQLYNPVR
jgi:hypothetical protein